MYEIHCVVTEPLFAERFESVFDLLVARGEAAGFRLLAHRVDHDMTLPRTLLDADVVVSRGLLAERIHAAHPQVEVVEFLDCGEVVAALYRGFAAHGAQPAAVYGSRRLVAPALCLDRVEGLDVKTYLQPSADGRRVRRDIEGIVAAGRAMVVCGPLTCDIAREVPGCIPLQVDLSVDAIEQALSIAMRVAVAGRCKQEKAAQFQAILNCSYEGIVATDAEGVVTVCNAAASQLLSIAPTQAIGRDVGDVIPACRMTDSFRTAEFMDKVVEYQGASLYVNKALVKVFGKLHGHVLTLRPGAERGRRRESGIHRRV